MLKPWTRYLLYIFTLPTDLIGWLVMLVVGLAWGTGAPTWKDGVLIATMKLDSWPGRTWYAKWGGTTIGHAVILKEGMAPSVLVHELVHVEQNEANGLLAAVLALALAFWLGWVAILVWIVLPWLVYLAGMLCAVLRGEDAYRGNHLEEGPYDHAGH